MRKAGWVGVGVAVVAAFGARAIVEAQAPAKPAPAPARGAAAAPARYQVHGNMNEVMRGILFPNSNVIFASQSDDPAAVKQAKDPSLATDPLTSIYGGWTAVENSG